MRRQTEQRGVRIVRTALLGALVVFLGVVSALFVARRGDVAPRPTGPTSDPMQDILDRIAAGEGFDYEVTEGSRRLFRIKAARVVTSRDGVYELEGVVIEAEQDSGTSYQIEAQRARYRERGREKLTTLEGGAVARSSTGAEISSAGFELRRGGKLVSSMAPVEFRLAGRLTGSARRFDAYLDKDRYQFAGVVRIESIGPAPNLGLRCQRLAYEESDRRVIADGGVLLTRGEDEVRAERVSALLSATTNAVEFVNARWNVAGKTMVGDELGSRLEFTADRVALEYDSETNLPKRAQFEVEAGKSVMLETFDETGLARRLLASFVSAEFAGGQLRRAEADEPVRMREYLRFSPSTILLDTCSKGATAEFAANGGLARLELVDLVTLHQPGLQANGDRLTLDRDDDLLQLRGSPAEIHAERGRLSALGVAYGMISRRLDASGGVRAELERSSGFSMIRPKEEEDEPVRVTSDTAMWLTRSREFAFTGDVRAWQGEDFVVAESLRGEEGGQVLSAEGDVKSVVAGRDLEEGEERRPESSPIEVTAGKLFYRRQERVVHYTGSPVARQAGRVLRCADLRLFLSPSSDLERLVCEGNVSVEDPSASRSVRGERAEYRPDAAVVEVSGNPAILRDPEGNEVRGPTVVYDLERQTARVTTAVRPQPPPEETDQ